MGAAHSGRRGCDPGPDPGELDPFDVTKLLSDAYFFFFVVLFLSGRCVSAEPAAVLEFFPVLLLFNTFDEATLAGIFFGSSAPLVHVVRFNGRCYLLNGFHRTFGARAAGATHVPCVLRDVGSPEMAGIAPPNTFDQTVLESPDPPTVGHYTQGRALPIQLRATTRVLHISWAEYGLPNE